MERVEGVDVDAPRQQAGDVQCTRPTMVLLVVLLLKLGVLLLLEISHQVHILHLLSFSEVLCLL